MLKELTEQLYAQAQQIIDNAAKDTKAAHQRIRRATLQIAKIGKQYRRESVEADKAAK